MLNSRSNKDFVAGYEASGVVVTLSTLRAH